MSLLNEIRDSAIDANINISVVLRKCKVLSIKLGNNFLKKWVDEELNGYKDVDSLPDYRIFHVNSKGHFVGPAGSALKNGDIPLVSIPEKFRKNLEKSFCMQPIAAYISILNSGNSDILQEPWPPDLVAFVGKKIYQYMNCISAWKVIPRASLVALVEAVRNRILNFVLEIENEVPNGVELSSKKQKISQQKINQVFNTTIYGNVGNIAEGGKEVSQTSSFNVVKNDLESLKDFFSEIGIPKKEIADLEESIKQDSTDEVKKNNSLGSNVLEWIGSIGIKISRGTFSLARTITSGVIIQAILKYYGIN
jgi:hypothetical protein